MLKIKITPRYKRAHKKIPKEHIVKIKDAITCLATDDDLPHEFDDIKMKNKALQKKFPKIRRIKPFLKDYRLAYYKEENILYLVYVGHRRDVYENLEKNL